MFYPYHMVKILANFIKIFLLAASHLRCRAPGRGAVGAEVPSCSRSPVWCTQAPSLGNPINRPLSCQSRAPGAYANIKEYESVWSVTREAENGKKETKYHGPRECDYMPKRPRNHRQIWFAILSSKIPQCKFLLVPTVLFQISWSQRKNLNHFL